MSMLRQKHRWKGALLFITVAVLVGCDQNQEVSQNQTMTSVKVLTVSEQPHEISSELPGRIVPMRVAEVRARVAGIVLSRSFTEGSIVKAGQILFQIDPAPFKAQLARAEGQLAQAEASLLEATSLVHRYEPLVKINAVSQQDFETSQTSLKNAKAALQSAQASVETAKLDLDHATVRAPISGHIGRAQVTEGALVGQNEATPMAVIQQLDPIFVDFRQSTADLLRTQEALEDGSISRHSNGIMPISLHIDGSRKTYNGTFLFSDVSVDNNTGEVLLRAQFNNAEF